MKIRNLLSDLLLLFLFAWLLAACGSTLVPGEAVATEIPPTKISTKEIQVKETPAGPLGALISAAQAEGTLNTIGLSHSWCNYGEAIEAFKFKYDLEVNEMNPRAGFGDEIQAIRDNRGNHSQSPDVIDLGFEFGSSTKEENLIQPYKVSTWDTIPAEVKDPDGYWYGGYYWVVAFLVNTDKQPVVPADWSSLLEPNYGGAVALSGDPRTSNQAIQSVFAAALANGGSLDDAEPGLNYFAQLNKSGNLSPFIATNHLVAIGQTPVRITWDYHALSAVNSFAGNPKAEVVIPARGRLGVVYVQAISAYAPHPNVAKLWMEFLFSDEGQLLWMKGRCHPTREADLRARGVIPEDLLTQMPDVSGAVFPTIGQLKTASALITQQWDKVVGVDIQATP